MCLQKFNNFRIILYFYKSFFILSASISTYIRQFLLHPLYPYLYIDGDIV